MLQARRYVRAGLGNVVEAIGPDVFHAHYVVEHGFFGSFLGFHPYVVSAWGSDLLIDSRRFLGGHIARRAMRSADLVTANDVSLAGRARELGLPDEKVEVVHLGIDRVFLEAGEHSVNLAPSGLVERTVISDRALEPLYHVEVVLRAFALVHSRMPEAKLIVASQGSLSDDLARLSSELGLGSSVQFVGHQTATRLADLLARSHVYVSVPASDSLALSTLEAMGAGAFPVVSDLPSVAGWIEPGRNGLLVTPGDVGALERALEAALRNDTLRGDAVEPNRAQVAEHGLRERTMELMERHYYRLAGRPVSGSGEGI